MGIIKVEISFPEAIRTLEGFKRNRLKALEDISSDIKSSIVWAINHLLHTEMTLFLGEKEQSDNKKNGYKERDYTFKGIGTVRLRMPQDRKSRFKSKIIPKKEVIDPRLKIAMARFTNYKPN